MNPISNFHDVTTPQQRLSMAAEKLDGSIDRLCHKSESLATLLAQFEARYYAAGSAR